MKWNIVTDSSCDLMSEWDEEQSVMVSEVPFIISVGDTDFVDDEKLDVDALLTAMEQSDTASHTACPGPQSWAEEFEKAEQSIVITISSQLSGSMGSASLAKDMVLERFPEKKIAVLDSLSTGPEITLCVERIREMIRSGRTFEHVVADAEAFLRHTRLCFALSSFDNLVKNGRMSRLKGFLAKKLGMWGVGFASDCGTIEILGKTRGAMGVVSMLIDDMKKHGFSGGKVSISHCQNLPLAEKLREKIRQVWSDAEVSILPTRGLCSYYAERGGLLLGY